MKLSLWDLKLQHKYSTTVLRTDHEVVPMGFETTNYIRVVVLFVNHEVVPMGFETKCCIARTGCLKKS